MKSDSREIKSGSREYCINMYIKYVSFLYDNNLVCVYNGAVGLANLLSKSSLPFTSLRLLSRTLTGQENRVHCVERR